MLLATHPSSGDAIPHPGTSRIGRAPRRWNREALHAYVFMSPAILGLLLFTLGPVVASLLLSFTEYNILTDPEWIGLQNYAEMFQDRLFWQHRVPERKPPL